MRFSSSTIQHIGLALNKSNKIYFMLSINIKLRETVSYGYALSLP